MELFRYQSETLFKGRGIIQGSGLVSFSEQSNNSGISQEVCSRVEE
jgi:hypothetical protein